MSSKPPPKNAGRDPSFQFYPNDWLSDPELRSCSVTARGLFIDLMCLMHRSKVYGKLMINGSRPEDKQVINLLRIHHKTYQKALKELLAYGVLKVDGEGIYYNARMMKDKVVRDQAIAFGKLGGNPALTGEGVNPPDKGGDKPSSSSPSSSPSPSNEEPRIDGGNGSPIPPPPPQPPMTTAQVLAHLRTLSGVQDSDIHSWRVQTRKHGWTDENWRMTLTDLTFKMAMPDDPVRSIPKYVTVCMLKFNGSGSGAPAAQPPDTPWIRPDIFDFTNPTTASDIINQLSSGNDVDEYTGRKLLAGAAPGLDHSQIEYIEKAIKASEGIITGPYRQFLARLAEESLESQEVINA